MTSPWPFTVHNIYIPESCDARQIECLSKAKLIQAQVFVGAESPYLLVAPYQHPDIRVKTLPHAAKTKWLPIPHHYQLPCVLRKDLEDHEFLLIHSGKGQLYWRCKSRDYIEFYLNDGAQWLIEEACDLRTASY